MDSLYFTFVTFTTVGYGDICMCFLFLELARAKVISSAKYWRRPDGCGLLGSFWYAQASIENLRFEICFSAGLAVIAMLVTMIAEKSAQKVDALIKHIQIGGKSTVFLVRLSKRIPSVLGTADPFVRLSNQRANCCIWMFPCLHRKYETKVIKRDLDPVSCVLIIGYPLVQAAHFRFGTKNGKLMLRTWTSLFLKFGIG